MIPLERPSTFSNQGASRWQTTEELQSIGVQPHNVTDQQLDGSALAGRLAQIHWARPYLSCTTNTPGISRVRKSGTSGITPGTSTSAMSTRVIADSLGPLWVGTWPNEAWPPGCPDGPWVPLNRGDSRAFPIEVWRQGSMNQPWWGFPPPDPPAVLFWGWWSGDYWAVIPSGNQVF